MNCYFNYCVRSFVLSVCGFLFIQTSVAQEDIRYWADGPLTIEDFKGDIVEESYLDFDAFINIRYSPKRERVNDSILFVLESKTMFFRHVSWMYIEDSSTILKMSQAIFNMAEIQRRKFHNELIYKEDFTNAEDVLQSYYYRFEKEAQQFIKKAYLDTNYELIEEKLNETEKELSLLTVERYPEVEDRNFKAGISVGANQSIAVGGLEKNISFRPSITMGFDFEYKRVNAVASIQLQNFRVKDEFEIGVNTFKNDTKGSLDHGTFGLGYVILNGSKFRATPYLGVTSFTFHVDDNDIDYTKNGTGFAYGVNLDYKFIKSVNYVNLPTRETVEHFIRFGCAVTNVDFDPLKGSFINLSLVYGYTMGGKKLKTKK